ncbi:MAG: hypothetical protein KDA83_01610 [Planctomycetales bacterium]|nr:hypothetical protein [Planctomycetales bacterium]
MNEVARIPIRFSLTRTLREPDTLLAMHQGDKPLTGRNLVPVDVSAMLRWAHREGGHG